LFRKFDVKLEKFLGVIMDFSAAQREGFILALRDNFGVKQHNALPFLKGCYMHWMQSVKRMSNNHQVVKPDEIDTFLKLVHRFRTTRNSIEFFRTGKELLTFFPNCKKWLQWWLQPGVSSMVFRCKSLMKDDLRQHKSRTSNAIEAFHSALYKLMPEKRQPVSTSLRLLLQVAKRDRMMLLMDFYDNNIRPHYGNKPKKPTKKYATLYEINDGRAPDNNTALFGTKKRKQEVVLISDAEEDGKRKAKKAKTRDVSLDAAIIEHLDETDEMERNCPKMDDFPDDDISDEKLFLELLSDDEYKSDKAENVFDRTEDLDEGIKNMFDGKDTCNSF